MSAQADPDVVRLPARRLPRAGVREMARTSPVLHRLLPRRLAFRWAERAALRRWQDPAVRADQLALMATIVTGTAREPELERLAAQHLVEARLRELVFWLPWHDPELTEESARNARAAFGGGRAVLVSANHLAPTFTGMWALRSFSDDVYLVTAPWMLQEPRYGPWGRYVARWQQGARRGRLGLVETRRGSFRAVERLLRDGKAVILASDMPGKRETRFLGKPVMFASGTAALAKATGAMILPMRARRDGARVFADFDPPLDADVFADADALHDAIFTVHERWVLELPEALEDPRRPGAWEDGATPTAWHLPSR